MAAIELKNITMEYGKNVKALKNVDLEVKDHEFMVLLGPSGCGKSTMLRIIAGLNFPTEGEVFFNGEDLTYADPKERNVSMVFQTYALYPHLNVFKNISFPLGNIKGITKEEISERVMETAKLLELEPLLNRKPRELSGGQKQRVALGRAMVRNPEVFLFDEPLSNLDVKMRQELRDVIAQMHDTTGTTFIYVTHDQSEAMQLGDRVAVMEEGVIRQIGAPQDVYNNPNCVYVAGFVGAPRMNFFASRFVDKGDHWAVKLLGGIIDIPVSRLPYDTPGIEDNGKIISGTRPEDLKLEAVEERDTVIKAVVEKLVPMGAGLHAELVANGTSFLAVFLNHTSIEKGEELEIHLDSENIHLFDPATEAAVCIPTKK